MSERSTGKAGDRANSERGPSGPAPKAPRAGSMSERSTGKAGKARTAGGRATTQLRLLQTERSRPLRARKAAPRARRAVHWQGQWRLNAQTRRIGREGVASARAALARAHDDELRRAS